MFSLRGLKRCSTAVSSRRPLPFLPYRHAHAQGWVRLLEKAFVLHDSQRVEHVEVLDLLCQHPSLNLFMPSFCSMLSCSLGEGKGFRIRIAAPLHLLLSSPSKLTTSEFFSILDISALMLLLCECCTKRLVDLQILQIIRYCFSSVQVCHCYSK